LTEVPVLSQAFLRSASTQYRHTLSPGFQRFESSFLW